MATAAAAAATARARAQATALFKTAAQPERAMQQQHMIDNWMARSAESAGSGDDKGQRRPQEGEGAQDHLMELDLDTLPVCWL